MDKSINTMSIHTWIKSLHAYGSFIVDIPSLFLQDEQIPVFR